MRGGCLLETAAPISELENNSLLESSMSEAFRPGGEALSVQPHSKTGE